MSLLSVDEIKNLIENASQPCVSVYMPTVKAGPEVRQNPIRFKNLLRQVEERLDAIGIRQSEAIEWLQAAQDLDNTTFWENQDRGLAIFASPTLFRFYSLPCEFAELVVVTDHFHLKPLLPLLTNDGEFYILALSQQERKFFRATRYSVEEIELENVPKSKDEALLYDETAQDGQHRIATSKGGTANPFQQPGSFHGQGSPDSDNEKRDILQFFHLVDAGVYEKLKDKKAPLLLAGVEYLFPVYKEANSYPHLLEQGILGNPENTKPEDLQAEAWQIVEPIIEQEQKQVEERYKELAGAATGKASHDIKEIISAAYYQRIDSLFVAVGEQNWGHFDPETNTVDIHSEAQPDDEDLLDFAAIHTLLNGGKVYAVPPEEVPDQAPVAAIFRY